MSSARKNGRDGLECLVADADKPLFSGRTSDVVLPGASGIVEVLPGHAECFVVLGRGEVVIAVGEEEEEAIPVEGGVAHVRDDRVVVLL